MGKAFGVIAGVAAIAIVAVVGSNIFAAEGQSSGSLAQAVQSLQSASSDVAAGFDEVSDRLNAVTGAVDKSISLPASDLKAGENAADLKKLFEGQGLSEKQGAVLEGVVGDIEAFVGDVDFSEWSLVTLPEGVAETKTYQLGSEGESVLLILYEDPRYLTVSVEGQPITMSMPADFQETIQEYVPYLNLLSVFLAE